MDLIRVVWLEVIRDRLQRRRGPKKRRWFLFEPLWMSEKSFQDVLSPSIEGDCVQFNNTPDSVSALKICESRVVQNLAYTQTGERDSSQNSKDPKYCSTGI